MTGLVALLFLIGLIGIAVSLVLIAIKVIKKKPKKKAGLALVLFFVLFVIGTIIMPKRVEAFTKTETPEQTEMPAHTEAPIKTEMPAKIAANEEDNHQQIIYYDKNDRINQFITAFNEMNIDYRITSDDLSVYHHHGRDHEDQVKTYKDGFEILLSDAAHFRVIISEMNEQKAAEEFKAMFICFALPYSSSLNEEILDAYWEQLLNDPVNRVRFDEFEGDIDMYNGDIGYLIIEGNLP